MYSSLCSNGVFQGISVDEFKAILRNLKHREIIEQMKDGLIILAPDGERLTHDVDFYSAFIGGEDYTVVCEGSSVGLLPKASLPPLGEHFILNGRRWRVEELDEPGKRVYVIKARGRKETIFMGDGGEIHTRVMKMMEVILKALRR